MLEISKLHFRARRLVSGLVSLGLALGDTGPGIVPAFLKWGFSMDLSELIETARHEYFSREYWAEASDAEVLGIMIAKYFRWNGQECFETLTHALEDSNFHSENRALAEAWRQAQAARA